MAPYLGKAIAYRAAGVDVPFIDYPDCADSRVDAESRFQISRKDDPFPEIADALLNSADIFDYVRMTGMLYPFHTDKIKSGSYEASIHGRCIWWNEKGEWQEKVLSVETHETFVLKANSIAFVQVEPFFRLPDYIALRFNLKITHVHRGILLGTGPLIDPGFEGELLIPLHNLTTNDYPFKCGEGLIWIEFTKTSRLPGGTSPSATPLGLTRRGQYIPFPDDKKKKKPEYYLSNASRHSPIRSSIPEAIRESQVQATKSANEAAAARKTVVTVTSIGGLIFLLTLAGVTYTVWSLIQDTWKVADEVREQLRQDSERDRSLERKTEDVEQKGQLIDKRLTNELRTLQSRMDNLARRKQASESRAAETTVDDQKRKSDQNSQPETKVPTLPNPRAQD